MLLLPSGVLTDPCAPLGTLIFLGVVVPEEDVDLDFDFLGEEREEERERMNRKPRTPVY